MFAIALNTYLPTFDRSCINSGASTNVAAILAEGSMTWCMRLVGAGQGKVKVDVRSEAFEVKQISYQILREKKKQHSLHRL